MDHIVEEYLLHNQWQEIIEYANTARLENSYNEQISVAEWKAKQMLNMPEEDLLQVLREGMLCNPCFYELFICLAEMKLSKNNLNQAYICLEQALFYCDKPEDKMQIASMMQEIDATVNPVSIIIASYNCCEMLQNCLLTIKTYTPAKSYEIVVVDNASTDGVAEWLSAQKDIKVILNKENKGFGIASNQGVAIAEPDNDIFFLNNDTLVPANAIFWLRMGLYEGNNIGATSCMSNRVSNDQMIDVTLNNTAEVLSFAKKHNIISLNPYEEKVKLVGFALLIKRSVLNEIGLFDEIYSIGNYEDDDISIRMLMAGYKLLLCHNSFIYHYGSQGFAQIDYDYSKLLYDNLQKFIKKWNFNIQYYSSARDNLIDFIKDIPASTEIKVLEIGCGTGATLAKIKYLWPNAKTYGIEIEPTVAKIATNFSEIIAGDIETLDLPYNMDYFDVIICGDVLEHLRNPEATLNKLYSHLKKDGYLLSSIHNVMHSSVLYPLLNGCWDYEDAGILDRTHLRFFTKKSICEMFNNVNLAIEKLCVTESYLDYPESNPDMFNKLQAIMPPEAFEQIYVFQYLIKSIK